MINGNKTWITNGTVADVAVVMASSDLTDGSRYHGTNERSWDRTVSAEAED